jgi:hypothetical protein
LERCAIGATDGDIGHGKDIYFNTSTWWLGNKVIIAPQWIGGRHWSDQSVAVAPDLQRETGL